MFRQNLFLSRELMFRPTVMRMAQTERSSLKGKNITGKKQTPGKPAYVKTQVYLKPVGPIVYVEPMSDCLESSLSIAGGSAVIHKWLDLYFKHTV